MINAIIFWVVFIGMIVGGILAGAPINGTIGAAGLWAIGSSFVSRKDRGADRRYKFGWYKFIIGLVSLAIAGILSISTVQDMVETFIEDL
ncbi:MAG: hypothetical protein ACI35T_04115 [Alistipes sp.]